MVNMTMHTLADSRKEWLFLSMPEVSLPQCNMDY